MWGKIRQHFNVKQILAIIAALLVLPAWVFNFENWLESRNLDRLFVDWEGPVSDAIQWVIRALSSDLALGIVIGALVMVFWNAIAQLPRWIRTRFIGQPAAVPISIEKQSYASPFEGKISTGSTEAPEKNQWVETSAYDLPFKLGVIDKLLVIVGSEKEFEQLTREGAQFSEQWEREIKQKGVNQFSTGLKGYKIKCIDLKERIFKIRKENEKYEDIVSILDPGKINVFFEGFNKFIISIEKLGANPSGEWNFFILPSATEFGSGLKTFGRWRHDVERALLARRKELSG